VKFSLATYSFTFGFLDQTVWYDPIREHELIIIKAYSKLRLFKNQHHHENFSLVVEKLLHVCCSLQLEAFKKQLMKSLSEDNLLVSTIDQIFFLV
jgi:hypothetical protein